MEDKVWYRDENGMPYELTQSSVEMLEFVNDKLALHYPKANARLEEVFSESRKNILFFRYLKVEQFIRCNFGNIDDSQKDINAHGIFNLENVPCPARARYKMCPHYGVICRAERERIFSPAEMSVLELFYFGIDKDEIAKRLNLEPISVRNHLNNARQRVDARNTTELLQYLRTNKIFKEE